MAKISVSVNCYFVGHKS